MLNKAEERPKQQNERQNKSVITISRENISTQIQRIQNIYLVRQTENFSGGFSNFPNNSPTKGFNAPKAVSI